MATYVAELKCFSIEITKNYRIVGRGLHSFTFQLNLSRVCYHTKPPYTP